MGVPLSMNTGLFSSKNGLVLRVRNNLKLIYIEGYPIPHTIWAGNLRDGVRFSWVKMSTCKVSKPRFNLAYFKLSIRPNCNRNLSASVPSTAIAQAIQEIEVLCQHRCTNRTAAQGRQLKQSFLRMSWARGYFSRHTGTKS